MLTKKHKLVNLSKKEAFEILSRRIKSKVGVFSFWPYMFKNELFSKNSVFNMYGQLCCETFLDFLGSTLVTLWQYFSTLSTHSKLSIIPAATADF